MCGIGKKSLDSAHMSPEAHSVSRAVDVVSDPSEGGRVDGLIGLMTDSRHGRMVFGSFSFVVASRPPQDIKGDPMVVGKWIRVFLVR